MADAACPGEVVERFPDEGMPFLGRAVVFSSKDITGIKRNNLLESKMKTQVMENIFLSKDRDSWQEVVVVSKQHTRVRIYLQELRNEATRQGLDLQEESVQQRSM